MGRTTEQVAFRDVTRGLFVAAGLERARIEYDAEGFPAALGRYGRIEWLGEGPEGRRLYVYTRSRRIRATLRGISGVHPWQIGDDEARFWFPADDPALLRAVSAAIGLRKRRPASNADHLARFSLRRRAERV